MDSLAGCIEQKGGWFFMPMFVQLSAAVELTEELVEKIARNFAKNVRHGTYRTPFTLSMKCSTRFGT